MFTIDTNQTIRISRGDDSGDFTLFVNRGTAINPIRHEFSYGVNIIEQPLDTVVSIDESKWEERLSGIYTFTYVFNVITSEYDWRDKDGQIIDLADYGITISGHIDPDDYIKVSNVKYTEEISLFIYRVNDIKEHALFRKVFVTNGDVITIYPKGASRKEHIDNIISENRDMKLFIDAKDTECIPAGEYRYIITAKLYDTDKQKYYINTVTNEHKFYILDTGYGVN